MVRCRSEQKSICLMRVC